jgi:DNA-binding LacI/PurR family transcriptional regulator
MGADAASTLLALIAGEVVAPGPVLLPPTLAIRSSTARPGAAVS